jgi:hypothetical protein
MKISDMNIGCELSKLPREAFDLPVTCRCGLYDGVRKCPFRCLLTHLSAVESMRQADALLALADAVAMGDKTMARQLKEKWVWGEDIAASARRKRAGARA